MSSLYSIASLFITFGFLSFALIFGYHHVYRSNLNVVGKFELVWVVPSLVPGLVLGLWLLGILDAVMYVGVFPNEIWTWWMPVGALLLQFLGIRFARWNRLRLITKRQRY